MDGTRTEVYYTKNKRGKKIKRYRVFKVATGIDGIISNEELLEYMVRNHPLSKQTQIDDIVIAIPTMPC